jgi:hypothetical protein
MNEVEMPLETRVRWEIWESFVSLLRSYAAAASLSGEEYAVSSFSGGAKVEHQGRALRFSFRPTTGNGIWRSVRPEKQSWGGFHISEDGTFASLSGSEALDAAAITWIEQLGEIST